jgi:hypothetical protein
MEASDPVKRIESSQPPVELQTDDRHGIAQNATLGVGDPLNWEE